MSPVWRSRMSPGCGGCGTAVLAARRLQSLSEISHLRPREAFERPALDSEVCTAHLNSPRAASAAAGPPVRRQPRTSLQARRRQHAVDRRVTGSSFKTPNVARILNGIPKLNDCALATQFLDTPSDGT